MTTRCGTFQVGAPAPQPLDIAPVKRKRQPKPKPDPVPSPRELAVSVALERTSPGSFKRFLRDRGVLPTDKQGEARAKLDYAAMTPLLDNYRLRDDVAPSLLHASRGAPVETVHLTFWRNLHRAKNGKFWDGQTNLWGAPEDDIKPSMPIIPPTDDWRAFSDRFAAPEHRRPPMIYRRPGDWLWSDFAKLFMATGQRVVEHSGTMMVYNPTTNSNGHRCNESTVAMHAAIFDCDGLGDWNRLLTFLHHAGYAYIAHRSRGHEPADPRWRVILPLARPFPVDGVAGKERWHAHYHLARVMLSAIGELRAHGFDPSTADPGRLWHFGTRRTEDDPPREVYWRHGLTFNIEEMSRLTPRFTPPPKKEEAPTASAASVTPIVRSHAGPPPKPGSKPTLVELYFRFAGLLGRDLGHGRKAVRCPWTHLHSHPTAAGTAPVGDTVIFPAIDARNVGGFFCSHNHCGGRKLNEVREALPATAIEAANAEFARVMGSVAPAETAQPAPPPAAVEDACIDALTAMLAPDPDDAPPPAPPETPEEEDARHERAFRLRQQAAWEAERDEF